MALPPFGWYNFLLVIMSSDIDEITITEVETETDIDLECHRLRRSGELDEFRHPDPSASIRLP